LTGARRHEDVMRRLRSLALVLVLFVSVVVFACGGNLAGPNGGPLATGRWTGGGACLSVTDAACSLAVGCGHGQFPRPTLRADGTFDVEGTYRIEAGPISIDPAPPAHFSGSVNGARLMLTVVPAVGTLPPASYSLTLTTGGTCPIPCV
jgi:hypothetical protein